MSSTAPEHPMTSAERGSNEQREPISSVLLYRIHLLSRLISTRFDALVAEHDITRAQWTVLMYVDHMPGAAQSELAEQMQMGRAAMGKILDRLEQKGFIVRQKDDTDNRVRRVFPREHVKSLFKFMPEAGQKLYDIFLGSMTLKEINNLNDLLGRMYKEGNDQENKIIHPM